MARRGKIKYKDVVKSHVQAKKTHKKPTQRKTYSLYNNNNKKSGDKRKFSGNYKSSEDGFIKKKKFSEVTPVEKPKAETESSSGEEEEEEERDLNNLLSTFSDKVKDKKTLAIESSSESEDDALKEAQEVENEEVNTGSGSESDIEDDNNEIVEDRKDQELEEQNEDEENKDDPFIKHIFYDLPDSILESLQNTPPVVDVFNENWLVLGGLLVQIPKCEKKENESVSYGILENKTFAAQGVVPKRISKSLKAEELCIKSQIVSNIFKVNKILTQSDGFSPLQAEIFSVINNYQDFYYPQRTFSNSEEIRFVYCLHVVNHILKTRVKVVHHNARLSKKEDVPEEFRDQGLVRPKVLIIVPFKDAAYKIIRMIIDLILPEDKGNVMNKNRFLEDYTGNELFLPKKNPKPEDYEQIFQGNTSDDFKIGITVTKKSLKLYADFYSSDIIVASPLGLRTIIGAEGEPGRDYDFLASIELLILDQTEIFLMQNWDHVVHVFKHLHLQPKESHGTDFSRVRTWSLNGWAKYYRQTLIFSSLILPEINAIFNKKCLNYSGKVKVVNAIDCGCIGQVVVQVPHIFHKFTCQNAAEAIDARFDFFVNKILPQQKESLMKQTLIFVPSYFDYVRIRNYFKKEDIGFVQICEYSKEGKVARARDMFYHGDAHFLLYTERYHFFNRKVIKGIRHLVFYQLPVFPHFYYEMCNLMQEANQNRKVGNISNMSVTVIYSKYDIHPLSAVVSSEKAGRMAQSDRKVHMMVTGND